MSSRLTLVGAPPPPIDARPHCPGCAVVMRPDIRDITRHSATGYMVSPIERKWNGRYYGYGAFHSQTCATRYANEMFKRHGTRFKRA